MISGRNTIGALVLTAALSASSGAQTIVNGNFTTDLTGWTTQNGNSHWVSDLGPDGNPGVMWLNDSPGIVCFGEQTITGLNPSDTYQINAWYQSRDLFQGPDSFQAAVDGNVLYTTPATSFVSSWTPFSISFQPTSSSAVLDFLAQVGSDSDYNVDEVSISDLGGGSSTPEPGTYALFASLCAGGAASILRRRRRR